MNTTDTIEITGVDGVTRTVKRVLPSGDRRPDLYHTNVLETWRQVAGMERRRRGFDTNDERQF